MFYWVKILHRKSIKTITFLQIDTKDYELLAKISVFTCQVFQDMQSRNTEVF